MNAGELHHAVNRLRAPDDRTSARALLVEYVVLAGIIAGVIVVSRLAEGSNTALVWRVVSWVAAIPVIGAVQHRLASLGHEASHHLLFRNRMLNETAGNWLCFYPIFNSVHAYRIQHMRHHQFTNDPELDPDLPSVSKNGIRFRYPMTSAEFWRECVLKPLLVPTVLLRFLRERTGLFVRLMAADDRGNAPAVRRSRLVNVVLMGVLAAGLAAGVRSESLTVVAAAGGGAAMLLVCIHAVLPERCFPSGELKPVISRRWDVLQQSLYHVVVWTGIATASVAAGRPFWLMYLVLWLTPLATTFAYYMLMRASFQHLDAGTDTGTNTRDVVAPRLVRWAVFPYGQDLHREHHWYPAIPQHRLTELRSLLQQVRPELYETDSG